MHGEGLSDSGILLCGPLWRACFHCTRLQQETAGGVWDCVLGSGESSLCLHFISSAAATSQRVSECQSVCEVSLWVKRLLITGENWVLLCLFGWLWLDLMHQVLRACCRCQALACDSSLTVVFEIESLSLRMIIKRLGNKYSNCLCHEYIAFWRQQVHPLAWGTEKWPES